MRRALRRAGWALAAAGGIGMAGPALAQQPAGRIIGPGGHEMPAGDTVVLSESQARFEEAQVELRFLADPMLFSYGLGAHVQGIKLEVRGFIPTEAQRDQALKLAREQTALNVVNKLTLAPNLATRSSIDKPVNIQRAAKELLEESFPEHGLGMNVTCDARGRVTVTGSVGSVEDKVMVSRKLRQVAGCACVANQLSVAGAAQAAPPAEVPHGAPTPELPQPTPVRQPVTAVPAVKKWEPGPVPAQTVAAPPKRVQDSDPPMLGMPRVHTPPAPLPAAPLPEPPAHRPPLPVIEVESSVKVAPLPPSIKPAPAAPSLDLPPAGSTKSAPLPVIDVAPPAKVAPSPVKASPVVPSLDLPSVGGTKPAPLPESPAPVHPQPVIDLAPPAKVAPPSAKAAPASPSLDLPPAGGTKPAPALKLPEVVTHYSDPAPSPPPLPPVPLLPPVPPKATATGTVPALPPVPPMTPVTVTAPALPPVSSKVTTTVTAPALTPAPPKSTTTVTAPALPPVSSKAPAGGKHDVAGGGEESNVTQGTISFDDPPTAKPATLPKPVSPPKPAVPEKSAAAPTKSTAWGAKPLALASPTPADGTLTLTPPPMPVSKPSGPVTLSAPPVKVPAPPAPAAPPRPTVPPSVRLKERIQGVCGPGYEVAVTARGKNGLQVNVAGRSASDGQRLMDQITPVLRSAEFSSFEINVDVTVPSK